MDYSLIVDDTDDTAKFRIGGSDEQQFTVSNQALSLLPSLDVGADRSGILPPVVRYISKTGRQVILERPPHMATIRYHGVSLGSITKETRLQEFECAMPWTVYAIMLNDRRQPLDMYMFAAHSYIQSEEDPLFLLPVPNCRQNGQFCTPYKKPWDSDLSIWSITKGIAAAYDLIWSSSFNADLNIAVGRAYLQRRPSDVFERSGKNPIAASAQHSPAKLYRRWEQFSLTQVAAWRDWPELQWGLELQQGLTVGKLIAHLRELETQYQDSYFFNMLRGRLNA